MIAASWDISQVHLWTLSKYKKHLSIQLPLCERHGQTADTQSDCRHTHTLDTHSDCQHSHRLWPPTQNVDTHSDCEHSLRLWTFTQTV